MVLSNGIEIMGKPTAVVGDGPGQIPPTHPTAAVHSALQFAQMGLDRDVVAWRHPDWTYPVLHLGPGNKHIERTIEYDWPQWDFDKMGQNGVSRFPYGRNEVGGVIATHVLEHLKDPRNLLREVSRILRPGAPFSILVPHGQSLMFLQDLDHKTPFVIETWKTLLNNPYYLKEHDGFEFRIGANFTFAVKESNTALVTQLIKTYRENDARYLTTGRISHSWCAHGQIPSSRQLCEDVMRERGELK